MSDPTATFASPLRSMPPIGSALTGARLEALGPKARLSLRLRDEAAIGRLEAAYGVALPREACRFAETEGRRALWLGPDEWLLVAPGGDSARIFAEVEEALAGVPHSLVDVSHRSTAFSVSGPHAASVLSAACPLDLSIKAFPVGMATRTVLGKTEIVLMRFGPEEFQVDVWRSFVAYAWALLQEALREFG